MREGWHEKRLKFVAPATRQILSARPEGVRYIGLENIESGTGRLLLDTQQEQVDSSVVAFDERSVLFGKLRPYLAKVATPDFRGVASTEIMIFEPADGNDRRFLSYTLLSDEFIKRVSGMTDGAKMPRANPGEVCNLRLRIPLPAQQRRIAGFLDEVTMKVDRLTALRRRQMELLREERAARIQQAVTRGLSAGAPLKDSGFLWLGQIPKHWKIARLKYAVDWSRGGIQMGPFGSMLTSLQGTETGFKLYGQENTINNNFVAGRRWITQQQFRELRQYEIVPGDIVLTRKGSIGQCRIVPTEILTGIIDSDTIRVRLDKSIVLPRYMVLAFQASTFIQHQIAAQQRGAILGGLNTATIANLMMIIPPLPEQEALLTHAAMEAAKTDRLLSAYARQLELLTEYRASLIHECVTGQRPVPA